MKKIHFLASLTLALILAVPATAQQKNKVQMSIDAAPVAGSLYDSGHIGGSIIGAGASFNAMVIPQLGFRAGVQLAALRGPHHVSDWKFRNAAFHPSMTLDLLWDIRNTFSKKSDLRYHIQPFFRFAMLVGAGHAKADDTSGDINFPTRRAIACSVGLGAGLRQVFKINDKLGIVWDMNAIITGDSAWHKQGGGKIGIAQTLVGLNIKL